MEQPSNPANGGMADATAPNPRPGDAVAALDEASAPIPPQEQVGAAESGSGTEPDAVGAVSGQAEPPAPPPATPSNAVGENADSSVMTLLQAQNGSVIEHLERLEAQLTDHLRANASCSRAAFDHLYDEMQAYKRNFLLEAQRPLLQDLMMLFDSIDKLRRNYQQAASLDLAALSQNLEGLQVEAEEILLRVGIERMTGLSDKLDVNLQRAVKTVATENPEENLQVVEQVRCGFVSGGQPLRKEQVIVKKYTPRAPSGSPSSADARESTGS